MDLVENDLIDYFIAEKALEYVNGDTGFVNVEEQHLFVGIFDGSGHGPEAHAIAQSSRFFLEKNRTSPLPELMTLLHEHLRGTRGGVGIIGVVDYAPLQFRYVAMGNVVLRKFGNVSKRQITQDGIIGYHIRTPREESLALMPGDILVLHTDGIKSEFSISDYPEILKDNAETIANNLIKLFGKNNDDATCVVIRFK
jgi:serine/threonine protein phosphatase PrpC